MAHTKGPWFAVGINAPVNINVIAAIGVEWCVHADAEFGDTEADASLIAAAPDLLAACEALRPKCYICNSPAYWTYNDEDGSECLCDEHKLSHFYAYGPDEIPGARQAQAAIAKAKGAA